MRTHICTYETTQHECQFPHRGPTRPEVWAYASGKFGMVWKLYITNLVNINLKLNCVHHYKATAHTFNKRYCNSHICTQLCTMVEVALTSLDDILSPLIPGQQQIERQHTTYYHALTTRDQCCISDIQSYIKPSWYFR